MNSLKTAEEMFSDLGFIKSSGEPKGVLKYHIPFKASVTFCEAYGGKRHAIESTEILDVDLLAAINQQVKELGWV